MNKEEYEQWTAATRAKRLQWWQEARFGMFIHWGLYSQLGRAEWVMNRERIPIKQYEKLAATWKPVERPAREWARLAKETGMKYMVMTTKHHEGFCLWDTKQTDYNAVKCGPGRDLVAEYVDACHEFGLKVGFYYSLMDWHHPDGAVVDKTSDAHKRFLDFTKGCVRELCSNYGKLDILWYDVAWPGMNDVEWWDSVNLNAMARELQPDILINNRSWLDEDFGTPEGTVTAEKEGRAWEACMTLNGSWGYFPQCTEWHHVREIIEMLRTAAGCKGNLLLNIGPKGDGTVPAETYERLVPLGKWVAQNAEAVYGETDRADVLLDWQLTGSPSLKGNTVYYWVNHWVGTELAIGGYQTKLLKASYLVGGQNLPFEQTENQILFHNLPAECPDKIANVCVLKLEFEKPPRQILGAGYVIPE